MLFPKPNGHWYHLVKYRPQQCWLDWWSEIDKEGNSRTTTEEGDSMGPGGVEDKVETGWFADDKRRRLATILIFLLHFFWSVTCLFTFQLSRLQTNSSWLLARPCYGLRKYRCIWFQSCLRKLLVIGIPASQAIIRKASVCFCILSKKCHLKFILRLTVRLKESIC